MLRSVLVVLLGVALWGLLWIGNSQAMAALLPDFPAEDGSVTGTGHLLWLLLVSVLVSLLCGNVAARLARRRPILHAAVLGAVNLAIGIGVQAGAWNLMPVWFHLSFLALLLPGHVLGGMRRADGARAARAAA